MKISNRPREPRRSAPVPFRPTTEFDVQNLPRPNSQIFTPTSMGRYNITPNSDQENHMLARILNWPIQNHHDQQQSQNLVGLNTKDNLVDDGEIIFDTTLFNQASDIQQPSHGQIPSYIPQGRFLVTAAMHHVINPSRAPEVPSLISTYGTEIFNQIQSDDDPRLIVWSISRAEERKLGTIISPYASSSKRWSIHEKLERAGKTICGSGLKDKFESKSSKIRNSNVMPEKVIMAATIEKLIEKLTSGIDYNFLTDFFLTYRAFITPLQLCNLLILRFNWALEVDDKQRRIVRIRTFVTLRHWLLNYFAYDFVPCRTLRSTLISYLNSLHSLEPRDQRIVQGLKRVIRRLKRIYYRKGVTSGLKNGGGGVNGNGTEKKMGEIIPESTQQHSDQSLDVDVMSVEHSEVGADTKSKKDKHESSSTLGSMLTPGTTDSEGEVFDSFVHHHYSRSRNSRQTEFRQSLEVISNNSQYSEDELPTHEDPASSYYNEKLSNTLPALTDETVDDWEIDMDNEKNYEFKQSEESAIAKRKLKLKSSSMGDLSQRKLQPDFNPLEHNSKDNDIIMEEDEPPPLPPRRRRRHTFTYTQQTSAAPSLPSFFRGGFLNFPVRKPKKVISQETMNEKIQDRTHKKRSLSLSEAICGFAENDDDEDEDDEFDLSRIDHAGGIVRRNSSPAYIGSSSLQSGQQEKADTSRRKTNRPSWPQKMSATVGKFAKVLFTPTGKSGGIKMLCANSEVVTTEDDSESSAPAENLNEDDLPIHLDGFSYVDESLEEELYDTMRQEDFAGTEDRFNLDDPSEEEEGELQEVVEDEEEVGMDDEGLTSSSTEPPYSQKQEKNLNEDSEEQENSQNAKSIRRKVKLWNFSSELDDPQFIRNIRRLDMVDESEENEGSNIVRSENKVEISEQGSYIEGADEHDENNPSSHRLRRLPKLRDLRSAVTLKNIEERSESFSNVEIETQEISKEVEQELIRKKDKSIVKSPSLEPVANDINMIPGSPKKSSESSVKRIIITEPSSKKLPDIPVQRTITTTNTYISAEPRSSGKNPVKNVQSPKSSLNKPLPPLPIQDNRSKRPPSISTTFTSQSQYRSFILNYRSEDIAKQFCLIERDFLLKVNWEDLVQVGYTSNDENIERLENDAKKGKKKDVKEKGKEKIVEKEETKENQRRIRENGVDKVIERFNLACDWVATEIVLTRSLDDRVQVIERFIRIAQKCLQFSNFATLTQILLGLQSPPVERLRRTWTRVRNDDLRVFKELSEYVSAFGNWKVIREAMRKSIEDSTILKELIKQRKSRASDVRKINTGCIPFLGLYLSDLVFNAAVPSFIDPKLSQPSTPSSPLPSNSIDATTDSINQQAQPLINFHKHRTTATIVKRVLTFQNLSRGYNFSIDKEIYDKCIGLKGLEATKLVVMDLDADDFV